MRERKRVQLCEVVDLITGFPFKSHQYTTEQDGIRLVRGDNVVQGAFRWNGVKRWPSDDLPNHTKLLLEPDDIVLAMDRPWIEAGLKYAVVRPTDCPALLVQRVARLRANNSIDARYLRYVVSSQAFTNHILAVQTGTAVPHISARQIKAYEFSLPTLEEQIQIGSVLSALDDKIELNRRINETLEAQARALFRDWFVDFGPVKAKMAEDIPYLSPDLWSLFPNCLDDDGVPEGWLTYRVDEIADHHTKSLTPMDAASEFFEHFSLPAYDGGQQPVLEAGGGIKSNKTIVPDGAILLSKLNPEIPRVWWPQNKGAHRQIASTEFLAFTAKSDIPPALLYSLFSDQTFRQRLEGMVTGTSKSHQRISPPALRSLEALVGEERVFAAFGAIAASLMQKVLANRAENRTLAQTRDLLLPKLMSGEIRVGDVSSKELSAA